MGASFGSSGTGVPEGLPARSDAETTLGRPLEEAVGEHPLPGDPDPLVEAAHRGPPRRAPGLEDPLDTTAATFSGSTPSASSSAIFPTARATAAA